MGYVARPVYRQLEWGLDTISGAPSISSVAGDMGEFDCTLPAFSGVVLNAYFDLNLGTLVNTNAGLNTLANTQYIQVKNSGGSYTNAIKFLGDTFQTNVAPANVVYVGRVYGSYNIADKINLAGSAGTITWMWHNAQAIADSLEFRGALQPIIRVWLR